MTKGILRYNRKTWHYKIMLWTWCLSEWDDKFHEGRLPKSLCPYLRKLVFTIPYAPFLYVWRKLPYAITDHQDIAIASVIISLVIHAVVFIVNLVRGVSGLEQMPWWTAWAVIFGGAAAIATIVVIVLVVVTAVSAGYKFIKCKRGNTEIKKPSTMCLFEDYIEAKHDKICPMIEFYDDEPDK